MKPAWKIMIALVLAVGLAAGGFLLGYQRMETYELSEPYQQMQFVLSAPGAGGECTRLVRDERVTNRIVENLMLQNEPAEIQQNLSAKAAGDKVTVMLNMEPEGNLAYLGEELPSILQSVLLEDGKEVNVALEDQQTVTVTQGERNSMTFGVIGLVIGLAIAAAADVLVLKKKPQEQTAKEETTEI